MWELLPNLVCLAVVLALARLEHKRMRTRWLEHEEERAFVERISVHPFDREQLQRLRPLVDHVGIIRVTRLEPGRNESFDDAYQVWVIDSVGVVHDVWESVDAGDAANIALGLAGQLDAELIDAEHITQSTVAPLAQAPEP